MQTRDPQAQLKLAAIIGAVVLVFATVAVLGGLAATGRINTDSTPLVTSILGFVGPTVFSLLAYVKTRETREAVADVKRQVNGHLQAEIQKALNTPTDINTDPPSTTPQGEPTNV